MSINKPAFDIPTTLSEAIYRYLKDAIVKGQIKPGERLQEKEIAALFNASSTPVREAFFRLSAEKYILMSARREVVVNKPSYASVQELYEIVRTLDKLAVGKVLPNLSDDDIAELKKMTLELEKCYRRKDRRQYLEENLKIHDRIWRACGNGFLYELLVEVMNKIAIYRRTTDFSPFSDAPSLDKSFQDHVRLMSLIEAKDLPGLIELIDSHWGEEFIPGQENSVPETAPEESRGRIDAATEEKRGKKG
jgi:DNA-binding GntR family transcriptional regulator